MRRALPYALLGLLAQSGAGAAGEVRAGAPADVAVTVYRAPSRDSGTIDLDGLGGFALVTETRHVQLPAGTSRVRFEGVANGILAESAIVTGLPSGLIEKNQDARLLTASALQLAALGKPLELVSSDRITGQVTRTAVKLEAAGSDGVVFSSAAGVEAWRCTGLSETFDYQSADGLSAAPTLSVLMRTRETVSADVTLSYITRGFDWFAQYEADLSPDGTHMDLGAWVTLANGNAVDFPAARAKVVAGRVNHEDAGVVAIDLGPEVIARCWPQQTTRDLPQPAVIRAKDKGALLMRSLAMAVPALADNLQEVVVTAAQRVVQEQLGDLKLYSVPSRTTIAARQSKQVRLMDRHAVPVTVVYRVELGDGFSDEEEPTHAKRLLRTKNSAAQHLGLALPSGRVALFERAATAKLLVAESAMRDLAVGEDLEIDAGTSDDVLMTAVAEEREVRRAYKGYRADAIGGLRVEVSNARASAINVELALTLEGVKVIQADHAVGSKNGHPLLRVTVPPQRSETVRLTIACTRRDGCN